MSSYNAMVVPTLGNMKLLSNISKFINAQTTDDFVLIFIVQKDAEIGMLTEELDKTIDRSFKIIPQRENFIIGAMNRVLELPYDNIILTDDDAQPAQSYIANAIEFLEKNTDAGCVFGKVNNSFPDSYKSKVFRTYNFLSSRKKLFGEQSYRGFNTAGMPIGGVFPNFNKGVVRDYMPIGVSMAWRQNSINKFRLSHYGKRGVFYESYISAALWLSGLETYYSPTLSVEHLDLESLSRSKLLFNQDIISELYTSPLILYNMGFAIDQNAISKLLTLIKIYPKELRFQIRKKLINTLQEIKK